MASLRSLALGYPAWSLQDEYRLLQAFVVTRTADVSRPLTARYDDNMEFDPGPFDAGPSDIDSATMRRLRPYLVVLAFIIAVVMLA